MYRANLIKAIYARATASTARKVVALREMKPRVADAPRPIAPSRLLGGLISFVGKHRALVRRGGAPMHVTPFSRCI